MKFVGIFRSTLLNMNDFNTLTSPNHIQVLIQRREIKKVNQPGNHANVIIETRAKVQKGYYVKGRKFWAHCPLTFCIAFLHVQKGFTDRKQF